MSTNAKKIVESDNNIETKDSQNTSSESPLMMVFFENNHFPIAATT